jgi:biopolymer transport protein ExbB
VVSGSHQFFIKGKRSMSNLLSVNSPIVYATLTLLILLSVMTWSIALFKLWKQWQLKKHDRDFMERFWSVREWSEAENIAQESQGDIARLAQAGFTELKALSEASQDLKHLGSPHEVLERQLRQQLQNIQRYHERGLAELASIGSTAPFIGLFGTVWGIMHALQDIGKSGSASLDVVAGPIGEALIATAIGIATALPAVLFYNFYLRRLKVHVTDLENFAHDFLRLAQKHDYKL